MVTGDMSFIYDPFKWMNDLSQTEKICIFSDSLTMHIIIFIKETFLKTIVLNEVFEKKGIHIPVQAVKNFEQNMVIGGSNSQTLVLIFIISSVPTQTYSSH